MAQRSAGVVVTGKNGEMKTDSWTDEGTERGGRSVDG
jgi:hypothetical protein